MVEQKSLELYFHWLLREYNSNRNKLLVSQLMNKT